MSQTFTDFEFIIINDGSSDNTEILLQKYREKDSRIVIHNQVNKGLTVSLNIGIRLAKGEYIARQDADDVSLPTRLEKQVSFLECNNNISLVGTNKLEVCSDGEKLGSYYELDSLNKRVFLYSPFAHTSAMFRKKVFIKIGLYNESFKTAQDLEAWMRFAKYSKISMLNEVLVKRYMLEESVSSLKRFNQITNSWRASTSFNIEILLYLIAAYSSNWIIRMKRIIFK